MASLPSPQASRDVATTAADGSRVKRFRRLLDCGPAGRDRGPRPARLARHQLDRQPGERRGERRQKGTLAVMVSAPRADFELLTPLYEIVG